MTKIHYMTSDRDKKCRICNDKILKHTYCIVMEDIHVSPKIVDLFFHEGCLYRALEYAKETRSTII
jgi:hypothetical protein